MEERRLLTEIFKEIFLPDLFLRCTPNLLKLVESYCFMIGGDRKKLCANKPVDIQYLSCLPRIS